MRLCYSLTISCPFRLTIPLVLLHIGDLCILLEIFSKNGLQILNTLGIDFEDKQPYHIN